MLLVIVLVVVIVLVLVLLVEVAFPPAVRRSTCTRLATMGSRA